MAVLIEGMEMPENGTYEVSIDSTNGKDKTVMSLFVRGEGGLICCGVYELIPVPPHGRLIDADALAEDLKRQCEEVFKIDAVSPDDFWITRDQAYNERLWKTWCESFFEYLKTRETIIPDDRYLIPCKEVWLDWLKQEAKE